MKHLPVFALMMSACLAADDESFDGTADEATPPSGVYSARFDDAPIRAVHLKPNRDDEKRGEYLLAIARDGSADLVEGTYKITKRGGVSKISFLDANGDVVRAETLKFKTFGENDTVLALGETEFSRQFRVQGEIMSCTALKIEDTSMFSASFDSYFSSVSLQAEPGTTDKPYHLRLGGNLFEAASFTAERDGITGWMIRAEDNADGVLTVVAPRDEGKGLVFYDKDGVRTMVAETLCYGD